ncbi:MAG: hypothetical protein VYC23_02860 [Chloroflexota bacterium]|nr:hypothetical protein [Chloroflexota bacterium]
MTITSDLSSSLSGALTDVINSLKLKAPEPYVIIAAGESEWYYDLVKKTMVRVLAGTRVLEVSGYPPDAEGRVVVQTMNNDIIRVSKEQLENIGFH